MKEHVVAVLQYFNLKNYRIVSFERLVDFFRQEGYTEEDFMAVVDERPRTFRHATIKGGLPGIALVDEQDPGIILNFLDADLLPPPRIEREADSKYDMPISPRITLDELEAEICFEEGERYRDSNTYVYYLKTVSQVVIVGVSTGIPGDAGMAAARQNAMNKLHDLVYFRNENQ